MALNIKDAETEQLAAQVAELAGETKTSAVRVALKERQQRLVAGVVRRNRAEDLHRFLAGEIWPQIPASVLGTSLSRAERESILGYGPNGV